MTRAVFYRLPAVERGFEQTKHPRGRRVLEALTYYTLWWCGDSVVVR